MFWENEEQASERLRRTVMVFGNRVCYINAINGTNAETYFPFDKQTRMRSTLVPLDDENWKNFRELPQLGFINTDEGVYYLARSPRRTIKHGIGGENTRISYVDCIRDKLAFANSDMDVTTFFTRYSEYWQMAQDKDYPTYQECLDTLSVSQALAFSPKHFVFRKEKSLFLIYREFDPIALVVRGQPILYSSKKFFREELEQNFGIVNILEE